MFNTQFDLFKLDQFGWFLSVAVFVTYGAICIIILIFTFSLDLYYNIDKRLNLDLFSTPRSAFLDTRVSFLDEWLFKHHIIAGPILIILAIIDIKCLFDIILQF